MEGTQGCVSFELFTGSQCPDALFSPRVGQTPDFSEGEEGEKVGEDLINQESMNGTSSNSQL